MLQGDNKSYFISNSRLIKDEEGKTKLKVREAKQLTVKNAGSGSIIVIIRKQAILYLLPKHDNM